MLKLRMNKKQYWIKVHGIDWLVEPMSMAEQDKLRKRFTETKRGVEKVDSHGFLMARVDAIIKDWKGACDADTGKPIPCDTEHKMDAANYNENVILDVIIQAAELSGEDASEEEMKNLKK